MKHWNCHVGLFTNNLGFMEILNDDITRYVLEKEIESRSLSKSLNHTLDLDN